MTTKDYEQKKHECWEEFCRANPSHNKSIFARKVFDFAFERAYALGKQEKEAGKSKKMCLRDKSKVCNMCHECDIDISNPYHNNVILS